MWKFCSWASRGTLPATCIGFFWDRFLEKGTMCVCVSSLARGPPEKMALLFASLFGFPLKPQHQNRYMQSKHLKQLCLFGSRIESKGAVPRLAVVRVTTSSATAGASHSTKTAPERKTARGAQESSLTARGPALRFQGNLTFRSRMDWPTKSPGTLP